MDFTVLGRTGLKVSVMGLGCGGHSRIGLGSGKTEAESVRVVREALAAGINIIDTAEAYQTEPLVGKALRGVKREDVIISTKKTARQPLSSQEISKSLESSLEKLGTDYIDIYHFHGVATEFYDTVRERFVPVFQRLQEQGKIRFLGITEFFNKDLGHLMLRKAVSDDVWDVMMVGFSILHQSPRELLFPQTRVKHVGILNMFAVRSALSRKSRLKEVVGELIEKGLIDKDEIDPDDPLGFLVHGTGAVSVPDAAYRFCRYEPGVDVVLSGTGSSDHLRENVQSFLRPPLPAEDMEMIKRVFGSIGCVSGE